MFKKTIITIMVFLLIGCGVFLGAKAASPEEVSLPQQITEETACPVVGCASGECHSFDSVPELDGINEMACPEVSCSSLECHAYDVLQTRYYQPSNASLNLWILAPVIFIVGLVLLVKKL